MNSKRRHTSVFQFCSTHGLTGCPVRLFWWPWYPGMVFGHIWVTLSLQPTIKIWGFPNITRNLLAREDILLSYSAIWLCFIQASCCLKYFIPDRDKKLTSVITTTYELKFDSTQFRTVSTFFFWPCVIIILSTRGVVFFKLFLPGYSSYFITCYTSRLSGSFRKGNSETTYWFHW